MRTLGWAVLALAVGLGCGSGTGGSVPAAQAGDQPGDPAMIAPFTDAAAFGTVNEAYSESNAAPWGFPHNGIDFFPLANGTLLRSTTAGTVVLVELVQNGAGANWQVNVRVQFNPRYSIEYVFEPMTAVLADGQAQLAGILVAPGAVVAQGQALGSVRVGAPGAHLHFGLRRDGAWVCPDPYFTTAGRAAVLGLIQRDRPSWPICYP